MIRKQILFADNTPDFLITRTEFLEKAGYHVIKTFSLDEARRLLAQAHVHLAILDIRMVNDDDENDISGLTLARDPAFHSIPKIILTGRPSVDKVIDALSPNSDGLPPAVDFVVKADGAEAMVRAVDKAFAAFVRINWDLDVQWDSREPLSFPHLAGLLQADLTGSFLVYRSGELEDLIRRIFYEYRHIRLGRLLWHDGERFCLPVLARTPSMATDLRILVCGKRGKLKAEQEQLQILAPDILQRTEFRAMAETTHFSANLYSLTGANNETVQTLRDLIQIGRERPLKTALTHLLGDVLMTWHQHGQQQDSGDLMTLYRRWRGVPQDPADIGQADQRIDALVQSMKTLAGLDIKRANGQVTVRLANDTADSYPDPFAAAHASLAGFDEPALCRVSPGRLTLDNVLIDSELHTWLTDFVHAGQAPQWWDFVCLEAAIRFDLSQAPDLIAWQEFEALLVKPARLDEGLGQDEVVPELRLQVGLIEQIRRQACLETGPDPIPYYAGLLVCAVDAMSQYDPDIIYTQADRLRGAHLLLASCMIAQRLGQTESPSTGGGPLRLDTNGKVWIGDRRVASLTGLRLKLLRCLFDHDGMTVSNQTIIQEAYGEKYNPEDLGQDKRIRQEIHRLREEIEPTSGRPRYILTERDKGYRLQSSGEGDV